MKDPFVQLRTLGKDMQGGLGAQFWSGSWRKPNCDPQVEMRESGRQEWRDDDIPFCTRDLTINTNAKLRSLEKRWS